ncbi:type I methionyl aminopeptidase [Leifsonia bigeumensis]|uniref:Methionine aminopeptidase n=1 Tax=Leifsonella bigeumensis TaxID=433643 RepID=A0ABP7F5U2_9MICO
MVSRNGIYKSPDELRMMVRPGLVTAASLAAVRAAIRPGVTTGELDAIAEDTIRSAGGEPNFMLVPGYHHTVCTSVNEEVVHGVPGDRVLQAGDIVSIDSGARVDGFNGDAAFTMVVPDATRPALVAARERLSAVTEGALWAGIAALAGASRLGEVGAAIEDHVESHAVDGQAYGILEDYVGHGIGRSMHEEPTVYNYRVRDRGPRIRPGLVVAIEPMVTAGGIETLVREDDWTVATTDGSASAHWEHSVAVHADGVWVLTAEDGGAAGLASYGIVPVALPPTG